MPVTEFEALKTYRKTRKYLAEKYPQPQQQAVMPNLSKKEEAEEPYDINIEKAAADPQSRIFLKALFQIKTINEKVRDLQVKATALWEYVQYLEQRTLRLFREILADSDVFEIVEAYFKICRKYHVPTFEEPCYFLSGKQRQSVKLEDEYWQDSVSMLLVFFFFPR
jgi:hypothetical protein